MLIISPRHISTQIYHFVESDCIIHGYIKKLGGPFTSAWQTRYGKLYPNRLELHYESTSTKPEVFQTSASRFISSVKHFGSTITVIFSQLLFMDQIDEILADYVQVKSENCIILKTTKEGKIILTNPVSFVLLHLCSSLHVIPQQHCGCQDLIS